MLEVEGLDVRYGAVTAVKQLSLEVKTGEIVALVGANGAGKTTTIKAIAGLLPYAGRISYDGQVLRPNGAQRNVAAGLVLVPEGRGILKRMTVEENLLMGLAAGARRGQGGRGLDSMLERFPVLGQRRKLQAHLLSGGEQQMLAIARALLMQPRLLLLDEPSLGLAPKMSAFVFQLIGELRREGLTVLVSEQRARQALHVASRAYVLETGRVVMSGDASALANDKALADAFVGGHAHAQVENGGGDSGGAQSS